MKDISAHDKRMAEMSFALVYPMYIEKIEKKGRTKAELMQVIEWLTGYSEAKIEQLAADNVNFETFFAGARLNPNAHLITGSVCGHKIQEIENPLTKQIRYLDKLVDELAKGKQIEKIMRTPK